MNFLFNRKLIYKKKLNAETNKTSNKILNQLMKKGGFICGHVYIN